MGSQVRILLSAPSLNKFSYIYWKAILIEIKRLTAKKACASEITKGKFFKKPGFESNYVLTRLGRKISRARVLGLIVDKFTGNENSYSAITIDDTSDTIRCKFFGGAKIFEGMAEGDLVDVVGKVREYNGEIYIAPEIVTKTADPNFETLRMLEIASIMKKQKEKILKIRELKSRTADPNELKALAKEFMGEDDAGSIMEAGDMTDEALKNGGQAKDAKEIILKIIGESGQEGADYQLVLSKSGLSESAADIAIQKLLEGGILFEPRPGKLKSL